MRSFATALAPALSLPPKKLGILGSPSKSGKVRSGCACPEETRIRIRTRPCHRYNVGEFHSALDAGVFFDRQSRKSRHPGHSNPPSREHSDLRSTGSPKAQLSLPLCHPCTDRLCPTALL